MSAFERPRLITRRALLAGGAGLAASAALRPLRPVQAAEPALTEAALVAAPARQSLNGPDFPATDVWSFGGGVPGPEIRVPKGGRLRVTAENRLAAETTVHWHGVRVPNAMDGVPELTQPPIAPGETFVYEFDCADAGTFWYHPHIMSHEQVERGLYGVLVVEEPPEEAAVLAADRELTWVLDDWRLTEDGALSGDFGGIHDVAHAGRIGNVATLNGGSPETVAVRAGERIRLRLLNAANARFFGLRFDGHTPLVVALDGHPVEPHAPEDGMVVLAPAQRADLVIDIAAEPGARFDVVDGYYGQAAYRLTRLASTDEPPLRSQPLPAPAMLPANPLSEPDLAAAERHEIVLGGGMMGGMGSAMMHGHATDMRTLFENGLAWAINGVATTGHTPPPFLTLRRGATALLSLVNDTVWEHPMHLHGHTFRVLARNGAPAPRREWLDTVLVRPRERVDIAFVADNPGDWMFHCHILEHQLGGMTGVIAVA